MFKDSFKYYKSKTNPPDLTTIIDLNQSEVDSKVATEFHIRNLDNAEQRPDCQPPTEWKVYELCERPGLLIIRNPFTSLGQRYWMAKCLRDYPRAPHATNLTNIRKIPREALADWWSVLQSTPSGAARKHLQDSMRWATLGYHHDWDTKVYSETKRHHFPDDLAELAAYFASVLDFPDQYSAEAAIVNFYPMGTTLAGHTDHSEPNLDAPLFSISFGQMAIFLIGGPSINDKPAAVFLRSGDIAVMSRSSRLSYHAVPRIMRSDIPPGWKTSIPNRIITLKVNHEAERQAKRRKTEFPEPNQNEQLKTVNLDEKLWATVADDAFWQPFDDYVQGCRININIRQVLRSGQCSLLDERGSEEVGKNPSAKHCEIENINN